MTRNKPGWNAMLLIRPLTMVLAVHMFCLLGTADSNSFPVAKEESRYWGQTYTATLDRKTLFDGPKWDGLTKLPISPSQALVIGEKMIESSTKTPSPQYPGSPNWLLAEMALKRFGRYDYWYYRIAMERFSAGTGGREQVVVFVTLSGKATPLKLQEVRKY